MIKMKTLRINICTVKYSQEYVFLKTDIQWQLVKILMVIYKQT